MREGGSEGERDKRRKGKAISGQVSLSPGINSASMGGTHASDKSGTSLRDRLLIYLSLSLSLSLKDIHARAREHTEAKSQRREN